MTLSNARTEGIMDAIHIFPDKAITENGIISKQFIILEIKTFVDAYKAQYGSIPTAYAANAYDTIMLIAEAIKKQDSVDANKIKQFLYQVKNYHGVSGKISFDSYGEVTKPVMLKQVKGLDFVKIGEK